MKAEEIVDQILQIKSQYENQVPGQYKRWPRAIRDRIRALADDGMKPKQIAEQTGISFHTVSSWVYGPYGNTAFQQLKVVGRAAPAAPKRPASVTVTKRTATATKHSNGTVTVRLPNGILIEGFRVADLTEFLRRMGVS